MNNETFELHPFHNMTLLQRTDSVGNRGMNLNNMYHNHSMDTFVTYVNFGTGKATVRKNTTVEDSCEYHYLKVHLNLTDLIDTLNAEKTYLGK